MMLFVPMYSFLKENAMSNVVSFKARLENRDTEDKFLRLLDEDIKNSQNIEAIPKSVFDIMAEIDAAAQAAREKRDLLEG
tara:strand:- start:544 stop:783 length:240 start_codon:yes stop_codon:yes gene_type:complete